MNSYSPYTSKLNGSFLKHFSIEGLKLQEIGIWKKAGRIAG
jgi:hypothetical protein